MKVTLTVALNAGSFKPHRSKEELLEEMQENSLRAAQAENMAEMLLQAGFRAEKEILQGAGPEGRILYQFSKDYPSQNEAEQEIFTLMPRSGSAPIEISFRDQEGRQLFQGQE